MDKGGINLFINLSYRSNKHKNVCTETCSFLEVKLWHPEEKPDEEKYEMRDKKQQPDPAPLFRMQVATFHGNICRIFHILHLENKYREK